MNKYELALVLSAKLEDEERLVDEWGKKRLAYEIQKEKEGFYYFIHFEAETAAPAEIESRVRIMEPVLRFLCVKQDA